MTTAIGPTCEVCIAKGQTRDANAHKAKWRCPLCRRALCNAHSKACSTMQNYADNVGKRVCSNCGTHMPSESFVPV